MKSSGTTWKRFLPISFIVLIVSILFVPLMVAKEYIFDDIFFVMLNPDFHRIRVLSDCFHFVLQPSKPITNFFLALGSLIGHSTPVGQHLLSLLLHLAVGVVWYFNLVKWAERSKFKAPKGFYLALMFLFLILPALSETLEIAQFRGEILATLFASLAILLTQFLATTKKSRQAWFYYGGIFLLLGVSQLSKEVFAIVVPPVLVAFFWLPGISATTRKRLKYFAGAIVAFELFWGTILYLFLQRDIGGHYSYSYTVGWKAIPPGVHIWLSARAIFEAIPKLFSAGTLTVIRIMFRKNLGFSFPVWLQFAILGTSLLGSAWLCSGRKSYRAWGVVFCSMWVYLLIPNANIGSEHYLYFCSFGFVVLLGLGALRLLRKYTQHPLSLWWLAYGVFAFSSISALENRLFECIDLISYTRAETDHFPEYYVTWVSYSSALMKTRENKEEIDRAMAQARIHAKEMIGPHLELAEAELGYEMAYGSLDSTSNKFIELMQIMVDKRDAALYEIKFAQYVYSKGGCGQAIGILNRAEKQDPSITLTADLKKLFHERLADKSGFCKRVALGYGPSTARLPASR